MILDIKTGQIKYDWQSPDKLCFAFSDYPSVSLDVVTRVAQHNFLPLALPGAARKSHFGVGDGSADESHRLSHWRTFYECVCKDVGNNFYFPWFTMIVGSWDFGNACGRVLYEDVRLGWR